MRNEAISANNYRYSNGATFDRSLAAIALCNILYCSTFRPPEPKVSAQRRSRTDTRYTTSDNLLFRIATGLLRCLNIAIHRNTGLAAHLPANTSQDASIAMTGAITIRLQVGNKKQRHQEVECEIALRICRARQFCLISAGFPVRRAVERMKK
jgi:hypothetical protein